MPQRINLVINLFHIVNDSAGKENRKGVRGLWAVQFSGPFDLPPMTPPPPSTKCQISGYVSGEMEKGKNSSLLCSLLNYLNCCPTDDLVGGLPLMCFSSEIFHSPFFLFRPPHVARKD